MGIMNSSAGISKAQTANLAPKHIQCGPHVGTAAPSYLVGSKNEQIEDE
jgi:hypothetical protein